MDVGIPDRLGPAYRIALWAAAPFIFFMAAVIEGFIAGNYPVAAVCAVLFVLSVPTIVYWDTILSPRWRRKLALAIIAISALGLAVGIYLLASGPNTGVASTAALKATAPVGPIYLTNLSLGWSNRQSDPVIVVGKSNMTVDRLRIFADFALALSEYAPAPMLPQTRVFIDELKEPVKGQAIEFPLLRAAHVENVGADYWWGNPAARNPFPGQGMQSVVYGRLVIIGPTNEEQYYCFKMLWPQQNEQRPFRIAPHASEVDWTSAWGCGSQ